MSELIVVTDSDAGAVTSLAAPKKQMNPKQLEALLFRLVIDEDLSGNTAFYKLKREYGQDELKKQNIEKVGDQLRAVWAGSPPAVRARMRLEAAEQALIGDLVEALGELELTNPRDIRDCVTHIQQVAGQQCMEHHLRDACDWLEEAGSATAPGLRVRFNELYPQGSDSDA